MDLKKNINNTLKLFDEIKPKNPANSYTSLASISDYNSGELLAFATGTQANYRKCTDDIQDCHAESLARRAFKRYLIDRLRQVVESTDIDFQDSAKKECPKELTLFVSQFPCGFVKRYQGEQVCDSSANVIRRKPGRGLARDGKVYYVEKDDCTTKLKKWIREGFQGKQIKAMFSITCKIRHIVIGNCEPNGDFDYDRYVDEFKQTLLCGSLLDVSVDKQIRRDEFVFSSEKKPQHVAVVCWNTSQDFRSSCHQTKRAKVELSYHHEFIVDGRRIGLTRKQCLSPNLIHKLKIANYCIKHDLAMLKKEYDDLNSRARLT